MKGGSVVVGSLKVRKFANMTTKKHYCHVCLSEPYPYDFLKNICPDYKPDQGSRSFHVIMKLTKNVNF